MLLINNLDNDFILSRSYACLLTFSIVFYCKNCELKEQVQKLKL